MRKTEAPRLLEFPTDDKTEIYITSQSTEKVNVDTTGVFFSEYKGVLG